MRARHGRNKLRPQIFQGGSHLTPNEGASRPTRREFLRKAAGAGLALAGSSLTAWGDHQDRKSTRLNSSHVSISYAVFCLKKKKYIQTAPVATGRAIVRDATSH